MILRNEKQNKSKKLKFENISEKFQRACESQSGTGSVNLVL